MGSTYGTIHKYISYRILVERPEGNRPLGRPRHGWEDNIKMNWKNVGRNAGIWVVLAYDRNQWRANVRAVMNLWVA